MRLQIVRVTVGITIIILAMLTPLIGSVDVQSIKHTARFTEVLLDRRPDAIAFAQDDGDDDDDDDITDARHADRSCQLDGAGSRPAANCRG